MIFFNMYPNLKIKNKFLFFLRGGWFVDGGWGVGGLVGGVGLVGEGGAGVSDFFFNYESKFRMKKKIFFGGMGGGGHGWTDEQAQTNLALQLLITMH